MWNNFKKAAGNLINKMAELDKDSEDEEQQDDQPEFQQDQSQSDSYLNSSRISISGLRELMSSGISAKIPKLKPHPRAIQQRFVETPPSLWTDSNLENLFTETQLSRNFDYRFRKGLARFGKSQRYPPPNMDILKEYMQSCQDFLIIQASFNRKPKNEEEMKKLQSNSGRDQIQKIYFKESRTIVTILLAHELSSIPRLTSRREHTSSNERVNQLVISRKQVLSQMAREAGNNSALFSRSYSQTEIVYALAGEYLEKTDLLRKKIKTIKEATHGIHQKINFKFRKRLQLQKTLYILEKLKNKYGIVLKHLRRGTSNLKVAAYADLYNIFVVSIINFRLDSRKYVSFRFFRKLEEAVDGKLLRLKKQLRNMLYAELKGLLRKPGSMPGRQFYELIAQYKKIAKVAEKLLKREGCPSSVGRDRELIWHEYEYMKGHNRELKQPRIDQLLKNSMMEGGL